MLEKEKYVYGFFVDDYFEYLGKKYAIEVNGPSHFDSCKKKMSDSSKIRILTKYHINIIAFDFKDEEELKMWHKKTPLERKRQIKSIYFKGD